MRTFAIAIAVVIVFVLGIAAAIAHYATTGEHDEPVRKVTVTGH